MLTKFFMLGKIVLFQNEYYILRDANTYGPYYSLAEAEFHRYHPEISKLTKIKEYKFIKNFD